MKEGILKFLPSVWLIPLLSICLYSGGAGSQFRFAFFPLMALTSLRLPPPAILLVGASFSAFYALMALMGDASGAGDLLPVTAELTAYLLTSWCAAKVASFIAGEESRFRLAETNFQGLSNELSRRSMNLQATLDALSQAHARLQRLDSEKTAFLAKIAHEIRTPLTGIRSYSEILLSYGDLDRETEREFMEVIQSESLRLTNLVNDLLDLIKIETGKHEPAIGMVDAAELITAGMKVMQPAAEKRGLELTSDIPPEPVAVRADRGQITQVIINLLSNAVKFTSRGSITLGFRKGTEFAEFFVGDTGEGIFPGEEEKIFDEFYRVLDNVPERPAGSGLGLSICKKIVEIHGGTIRVESRIGEGSTFSFTIPLFNGVLHDRGIPLREKSRHSPGEVRPILVVVRNTVKRMCLRKSLENVGYSTYGAVSYDKACDLIKYSPIDLIIGETADDRAGVETLASAVQDEGTPFFLAHFHVEPQEDISIAFNGYIWKPFERNQLLQAMEPLKMGRKRIAIISKNSEESRILQMLLGIEGYQVTLIGNNTRLPISCTEFGPNAVIIGTYAEEELDTIISALKKVPQLAGTPLLLVLDEKPHGNLRLVSAPHQDDKPLIFGLSPLIHEIERAILK